MVSDAKTITDYLYIIPYSIPGCVFAYTLVKSKTTNMGSLFILTYEIALKDKNSEKKFVDELRCRNGNLEIQVSRLGNVNDEL